jgi:hypothetical protein
MSDIFVRQQLIAPLEPPRSNVGTPTWLRQRLFGSVLNAIATIVSAVVLAVLVWPAIRFMLIEPGRLSGGDGRPSGRRLLAVHLRKIRAVHVRLLSER